MSLSDDFDSPIFTHGLMWGGEQERGGCVVFFHRYYTAHETQGHNSAGKTMVCLIIIQHVMDCSWDLDSPCVLHEPGETLLHRKESSVVNCLGNGGRGSGD